MKNRGGAYKKSTKTCGKTGHSARQTGNARENAGGVNAIGMQACPSSCGSALYGLKPIGDCSLALACTSALAVPLTQPLTLTLGRSQASRAMPRNPHSYYPAVQKPKS